MKVYLAGPMTGREHYNFREFQCAKEQLGFLGHEVKTPFDADNVVWQRHFQRDFDPTSDKCDYDDELLAEMIIEDIKLLHWSDAIVMLQGWEGSKGTLFELSAATLMRRKVFEQTRDGFDQITHDVTATVHVTRRLGEWASK